MIGQGQPQTFLGAASDELGLPLEGKWRMASGKVLTVTVTYPFHLSQS